MKTQTILSAALYLILGVSAFAGAKLPSCGETAEHTNVGGVCRTQAGFQFKRYQNAANGALGWEEVGGKVWFDETQSKVNAQEALNFCTQKQSSVPSFQDYKTATDHGIQEIFKDASELLFWTSDHELSYVKFPTHLQTSFITYPYQSRATISRELNIRCNGVSGVNAGLQK